VRDFWVSLFVVGGENMGRAVIGQSRGLGTGASRAHAASEDRRSAPATAGASSAVDPVARHDAPRAGDTPFTRATVTKRGWMGRGASPRAARARPARRRGGSGSGAYPAESCCAMMVAILTLD